MNGDNRSNISCYYVLVLFLSVTQKNIPQQGNSFFYHLELFEELCNSQALNYILRRKLVLFLDCFIIYFKLFPVYCFTKIYFFPFILIYNEAKFWYSFWMFPNILLSHIQNIYHYF